jgi:hypothetical protein
MLVVWMPLNVATRSSLRRSGEKTGVAPAKLRRNHRGGRDRRCQFCERMDQLPISIAIRSRTSHLSCVREPVHRRAVHLWRVRGRSARQFEDLSRVGNANGRHVQRMWAGQLTSHAHLPPPPHRPQMPSACRRRLLVRRAAAVRSPRLVSTRSPSGGDRNFHARRFVSLLQRTIRNRRDVACLDTQSR